MTAGRSELSHHTEKVSDGRWLYSTLRQDQARRDHTSRSFLTVETQNRQKPWKESDPLKQEKDPHKEKSTKNRNSAGLVKVVQAATAQAELGPAAKHVWARRS